MNFTPPQKPWIYGLFYLAYYVILVIFVPDFGHYGDHLFWSSWAKVIAEHGQGNVYFYAQIDYPPLATYFLYIYSLFFDNPEAMLWEIRYIKPAYLLFDFVAALSLILITPLGRWRYFAPCILLFNPAYLFDSYIWTQCDGVYVAFMLLCFIFILRKQPVWASLFFLLGLNMKLQSIIFFPAFMFAIAPLWVQSAKKFYSSLGVMAIAEVIILIPFIMAGSVGQILHNVMHSVDEYPVASMNAFNIWYLLLDVNPYYTKDNIEWMGITYKNWGLMMFFIMSAVVLMPLFIYTLRSLFAKGAKPLLSKEMLFLSLGVVNLVFFFFNTQMHERYGFPAIAMFAAYALITRRYVLLLLTSLAVWLNMENVLDYLTLQKYHYFFFSPEFIAVLFSIIIAVGIYHLYRYYPPAIKTLLQATKKSPHLSGEGSN